MTTFLAVCAFKYTALVGFLTLIQEDNHPVKITGTIQGLPPGEHGVIVHQNPVTEHGKCDNLGPHFDDSTHHHHHGPPGGSEEHHTGDLGNIFVQSSGTAVVSIVNHDIKLTPGDPKSVIGHSIAIYERKDTGEEENEGNAGKVLHCCTVDLIRRK